MCSWYKSNVLEEVDSSHGSELDHNSMVEPFGCLQPYLFELKNQIFVKIALDNCK